MSSSNSINSSSRSKSIRMRPTASLRWRAAIACVCALVLYLYARQNSQTRAGLEYLRTSLTACEQNGESVVAKLNVVHQHKQKIEELYRRTMNESAKSTQDLKDNLRRCELNHISVKERLSTCEDGQKKQVPQPVADNQQQITELHRRAAELERELNATRAQLNAAVSESDRLRKRADACDQQLVAHVGAIPKEGYSQNETAHFERNHKKDGKLEFHRDGEGAEPAPIIIPAKELVKKLDERNRQRERGGVEKDEDKHPDDRNDDDAYVVEKPNPDDAKDYKEHE